MIEFRQFAFAAPPCVGAHWFVQGCRCAGMELITKGKVFEPPPANYSRYVLSIVRHPFSWLHSYYTYLSGHVVKVDDVDIFSNLYRAATDYREFVRLYLMHHTGAIGEMFDAYRPSTVIRFEDLPSAAVEFAHSHGFHNTRILAARSAIADLWDTDRELHTAVCRAERDFCERLDYV